MSVFGSDRKYWNEEIKTALGIGGFPFQLAPAPAGTPKISLPISAVPLSDVVPSLRKIFDNDIKIYVTPTEYFTTNSGKVLNKHRLYTHRVKSRNTGLEGLI